MDSSYPDVLKLPHIIGNADRRCMIVIDSKDRRFTSATWYDIWEAATVLTARCARTAGKTGRVTGLGSNGKIHVTLKDE